MKQPTSQAKNESQKLQHAEKAEQKDKQKKNELVIHHSNGVAGAVL